VEDYERYYKGVEELGGQCPSRLAQELVEQQLDGVVSGQRGYETQSGSYQLRGFVQYLAGHRFLLNFFSVTLGTVSTHLEQTLLQPDRGMFPAGVCRAASPSRVDQPLARSVTLAGRPTAPGSPPA
jgi:hypothetical protein